MASRSAISKYKRQGGKCFYCDKTMKSKQQTRTSTGWTKDHFIARALGGTANWINIVLACEACNVKKAHRLPTKEEITKFLYTFDETKQYLDHMFDRLRLNGVIND